jgi:hypothetical protein
MVIKLVVGELEELRKYKTEHRSKNGFYCRMVGFE